MLILKNIKVENYRCIQNTEEFSIAPVTCIVGKNESGKTALLQALYRLNPVIKEDGKFDSLLEYPRNKWSEYSRRAETSPDNVLTTKWEVDEATIQVLTNLLGEKSLITVRNQEELKMNLNKLISNKEFYRSILKNMFSFPKSILISMKTSVL